jgi:hypothetical protein
MMRDAGIDMTRQGYAMANWGQLIEDLEPEQLMDIPAFLPDDPEGDEGSGSPPKAA